MNASHQVNPLWLVPLGVLFLLGGIALIRYRGALVRYSRNYMRTWGRTVGVNPEPWEALHRFGLAMMGVVFAAIGLFIIAGSIYWALQPEKWPTMGG